MRRIYTLAPFVALLALSLGRSGQLVHDPMAQLTPAPTRYVLTLALVARTDPTVVPPLDPVEPDSPVAEAEMPALPPPVEDAPEARIVAVALTAPQPAADVASMPPTEVPTPTEVPPTPTITPTPLPSPTPTETPIPPTPTPEPPPPTEAPPPATAPEPAEQAPAPAQETQAGLRERIVAAARRYAEAKTKYRSGHTGPELFDCTGLVYRVFADCGAEDAIGARGEQGVRNYHQWFLKRNRADLEEPKMGDLIIYGNYVHIGIYIGNGRAISTLSAGVREHDAFRLRNGNGGPVMAVKAYLHIEAE